MTVKQGRRGAITAILIAGVLWGSGCATLGPVYTKVDKVPQDRGLVYIYRPSSIMGSGVAYDVKVGDNVVTTLHSGGYFPYFSTPGEVEFWAKTESRSAVTIDVKSGQVYYIKGSLGVGFFVGRPHLMVVPADVGEKEIAECKLIPEPKKEETKEESKTTK